MLSDISITAYLLHRPTYAADAKKQLGGKANLLESCFGGWIIYVWGLSVAFGGLSPLSLLVALRKVSILQ